MYSYLKTQKKKNTSFKIYRDFLAVNFSKIHKNNLKHGNIASRHGAFTGESGQIDNTNNDNGGYDDDDNNNSRFTLPNIV